MSARLRVLPELIPGKRAEKKRNYYINMMVIPLYEISSRDQNDH
jgi:hypothetical protein